MARERRPLLEALEARDVPAAFGTPWADGGLLSLSIAPDGTAIAGHTSGLAESLDAQGLGDWRRTLLTAFQTWAAHADLDFAWRADGGQAFGAAGLPQGDPRFGDIRIGGHDMGVGTLAVGIPPDPTLSGTWAGDILFNTAVRFDGSPYSLLAVAMHEAGHSLGLDNSTTADAVMFTQYGHGRTTLSAEDVSRIQALYGARTPDAYEGTLGNDSRARASSFRLPAGHKGETPLVAFGDITRNGDVDFYRVAFPPDGNDDVNQGELTIRLQTSGTSLMTPRLTVLDDAGRVLATRTSDSLTGDTLQVSLTGLATSREYFVKVEGATGDVFGVGRYGLSVRHDKTSGTSDGVIDELIRSPYATSLTAADMDAFFRTSGDTLFQYEEGRDTAALPLDASGRGSAVGSITKKEDVDVYRLNAPSAGGVLTATARTVDEAGFMPRLRVVDSSGRDLGARVLSAGDGTTTVQIDAVAGRAYFLEVSLAPGATQDKGNYLLNAEFTAPRAETRTFADGAVGEADRSDSTGVYVAQAHLFHFVLTAGAGDEGSRLRFTLTDSSGRVVHALEARPGESASGGSVLLAPGWYTARVEIENPNGRTLTYRLGGSALSDPIGPVTSDPTLAAKYTTPPPPPGAPAQPAYTYTGFVVPYDPSGYAGYIKPGDPLTYPAGYVLPAGYGRYPWLIATDDPYFWIALGA